MSTCPDQTELQLFLEGELSDAENQRISDHVEVCAGCEQKLAELGERAHPLLPERRLLGSTVGNDVPGPEATPDNGDPRAAAAAPPAPPALRYRLLRYHDKGNLGEVWLAEDEEPHREVALKRIQERHRN